MRAGFLSFQVACTYIGTVVGAGFASGQEVLQFFGRYGTLGYVAVIISTVLFAWIGYRMMELGHRLKAKSFQEVNAYIFGPKAGLFVDILMILMLVGVTVAMLAGAGELFQERLGLPFLIGVLTTSVATFFTVLRGISGLLRANTLIVPVMTFFVLLTAIHTAILSHHFAFTAPFISSAPKNAVMALLSAVIYTGFNVGLAAGVLIPIGASVPEKSILRRGSVMGAVGLGMMLFAVLYVLFSNYRVVWNYDVPMAYVAQQLGPVLQWLFVAVLWGEIFSTVVGDAYAVTSRLTAGAKYRSWQVNTLLLVVCILLSHIGFSAIVHYGYTLFGWISTMLLFALLWPGRHLQRH